MFKIISNIPLFVWPLLAVLVWGGLKATKTASVPLLALLAIPCVLFGWTVMSFFGNYGVGAVPVLLWMVCLGVGFLLGFAHIRKLELRFEWRKVVLPGSWIPMILSLSIFSAKFAVGMMSAMHPEMRGGMLLEALDLFATVVLGVFAGRGVGCLIRYRVSG